MRLAAALCTLLAGCAAAAPSTPSPDAAADAAGRAAAGAFERRVAPFTVLDHTGAPYAFPFLGGFDVPRPQFVDIDGDADLDLFVQERSNSVMFFENTGTAEQPVLAWRTDRYAGLDVGEWYRFVDMDSDDDYDVIAEELYSHIRMFRNVGSASDPELVLFADTLRDADGTPIFADRQNIANAADIDCNGLMDLFIGRVDGTVARYEETPRAPDAVPRFRLVTQRFENIEIVAQVTGSRHGANSMYFADHDGDGDLDLFWGDFFEPGVLLIRNQSASCRTPNLRVQPEPLRTADGTLIATSGYNVPLLRDIDADGDLDLFLGVIGGAFNPNRTAADNFHFYERTAAGYELRSTRFLNGIDFGSESVADFADIDADGDQDMLVGSKIDPASPAPQRARLHVFLNTGTANAPAFGTSRPLELSASFHYAPAFADLDADGSIDLLLGTWNDGVQFYRGAGRFTPGAQPWVQDSARTIAITRGSNTAPALVDIDADGDLDLFIGEASGTINFYRNAGSVRDPRFELVSDELDGIDVGRRSHPAFVDYDGDGDFDMVVGREEGGAALFRNTGTRTTPSFTLDPTVELELPPMSAPVFVDLDADGAPELVSGTASGGLVFYRRR